MNPRRITLHEVVFIATVLTLLLAGCSPEPESRPELQWTPLPSAAVPGAATQPAAAVSTEVPAEVVYSTCANEASFLEDLTYQDGTVVDPGQIIVKRWSVQNTGSCDWGAGYQLMPMWDNPFEHAEEQGLYPARAGAVAIWEVEVVAPQEPGTYFARWQAYSPDEQPFGVEVYLLIEVVAPTPTPTVTSATLQGVPASE